MPKPLQKDLAGIPTLDLRGLLADYWNDRDQYGRIIAELDRRKQSGDTNASPDMAPVSGANTSRTNLADQHGSVEKGSSIFLIAFGGLWMLVGLYFLLDPSGGEVMGQKVIDIQRLTVGETFIIAGAIFAAAGLRPR